MAIHNVGIIMNGVTGRMGTNQHLIRSILAIRNQGGVTRRTGTSLCRIRFWSAARSTRLRLSPKSTA
ncbi:hypothetical protein LJK88_34795 [Paenibacillus sp. P26]|nr:hypothetical protein LJK88_34795 [Paenibacillus sp. P26]